MSCWTLPLHLSIMKDTHYPKQLEICRISDSHHMPNTSPVLLAISKEEQAWRVAVSIIYFLVMTVCSSCSRLDQNICVHAAPCKELPPLSVSVAVWLNHPFSTITASARSRARYDCGLHLVSLILLIPDALWSSVHSLLLLRCHSAIH